MGRQARVPVFADDALERLVDLKVDAARLTSEAHVEPDVHARLELEAPAASIGISKWPVMTAFVRNHLAPT